MFDSMSQMVKSHWRKFWKFDTKFINLLLSQLVISNVCPNTIRRSVLILVIKSQKVCCPFRNIHGTGQFGFCRYSNGTTIPFTSITNLIHLDYCQCLLVYWTPSVPCSKRASVAAGYPIFPTGHWWKPKVV